MECKFCGNEIPENSNTCPVCQATIDNITLNHHYDSNISYTSDKHHKPQDEKASIGLAIIALLFPIIGLIFFVTTKQTRPKAAKVIGTCALVSFILSTFIPMLLPLIAMLVFNVKDNAIYDQQIEQNIETTVDENWVGYEFKINGEKFVLPCSYGEFLNRSGLYKEYHSKEKYLSPGENDCFILVDRAGNSTISVGICNNTDHTLPYSDCEIVSIQQTSTQSMKESTPLITFPGGLQVSQQITKEELLKTLGEPRYTHNDGVVTYIYTEGDNMNDCGYAITTYNGNITWVVLGELSSFLNQ
jgi:hypothetical protein